MKHRSKKRRLIYYGISLLIVLAIIVAVGEVVVRMMGYQSAHPSNKPDIEVQPGNSFYQRDSVLGYDHLPGKYKITIKDSFVFRVSNTVHGNLRRTHPPRLDSLYENKDKIWVMGGSCTYGWSLNDTETYVWKVQEKVDDYELINFGMAGFGTIHSLLQIENNLGKMKKPEIIVIAYAGFHDDRNTYNPRRKKEAEMWNFLGPHVQPYARLDENGELIIHRTDTTDYKSLMLSKHSALVNSAEKAYNIMKSKFIPNQEVSRRLIDRIHKICKENDIQLIVAGINLSKKTIDMIRYCKKNNIPAVNIGVDNTKGGYTNLPYDGHPNAKANTIYAERLYEFLKDYL